VNCKPGYLAYLVYANPEHSDAVGRVVEVLRWSTEFSSWEIEFVGPRPVSLLCWMAPTAMDSSLRPISGVPIEDETPIETNVPEALKLALGIESRSYA
jgi:hypothetical protein